MCDYSQENVKFRTATALDKLMTHNFDTGTFGFRASDDQATGKDATALCILPGTEIAFMNEIKLRPGFALGSAELDGRTVVIGVPPKPEDRTATFVQVDKRCKTSHHDALLFANGNVVLLNSLDVDQEALIVTLPAKPETPAEHEEQRRVEYA